MLYKQFIVLFFLLILNRVKFVIMEVEEVSFDIFFIFRFRFFSVDVENVFLFNFYSVGMF